MQVLDWTTLEGLRSWQTFLIVLIVVLGILGALLGLLAHYVGKSKDRRLRQGFLIYLCAILSILIAVSGWFIYDAGERIADIKGQATRTLEAALAEATDRIQGVDQKFRAAADELVEAEGRILGLEKKSQPRLLTLGQKRKMVSFLRGNPPLKLAIFYNMGDSEAAQFASGFVDVFREADWVVESGSTLLDSPISGIVLLINPKHKAAPPLVFHAVHRTLEVAGFQAESFANKRIGQGEAELFIGSKE